jgi:hypothetical protein
MSGGRQRANPVDGALARLADLAGRGVQPSRMTREVETIVSAWCDGPTAAAPDEVSERLTLLHEQLIAGVEAAAEQVSDVDRSDSAALRHAGLVHAALVAAAGAVEHALQAPRSRSQPEPAVAARPTAPIAATVEPTRPPVPLLAGAVTIPPLVARNPQGVDHSYPAEVRAETAKPAVATSPLSPPTQGRKKRTKKVAGGAEQDLYSAAV